MPKHEFGIMSTDPIKGKHFDRYEPQKYDCISVNDDFILPLLNQFGEIKCYWHTLDRYEFGLAYWGITLIPPESLDSFIKIISDDVNMKELFCLLSTAKEKKVYHSLWHIALLTISFVNYVSAWQKCII